MVTITTVQGIPGYPSTSYTFTTISSYFSSQSSELHDHGTVDYGGPPAATLQQ